MSTYPDANSLTIPVDDRITNKYPLPADWDPTDKTLLDATRLMAMFTNLCNGAYRNSIGKIYATLTALEAITGEKGEIAYCTETDNIYKWDTTATSWIKLSDIVDVEDIEDLLATKVDKATGKGLSTNDYTTNEKNKLAGIDTGAEVNDVVDVKVNGVSVVNGSKIAQIDLTKTQLKLFLVPSTITPVSGTATVVLEDSKVIYDVTPVEATTLVFDVSGLTIPTNNYIAFNLTLNMSAGVQTMTFPASVQWGNVSPTLTSAVKYMFSFFSPDGGTTWIGNQSASWIVGA